MSKALKYSVFTKPWKDISLEKLADKVAAMGFDAVEYPLREGYQIQPADGIEGMKRLRQVFSSRGLEIASIAGGVDVRFVEGSNEVAGVDETLFAGCQEAGCGIIRICQNLDGSKGFHKNVEIIRRTYDAMLPYCEKYNVTLGVQMHCGESISNSAETYILLKDYDPRYVAAVWDSGHSGLAGNDPRIALDLIWDQLCMVNFKAAYRYRTNGPEAAEATWNEHWTTAKNACGSWAAATQYMKQRGFEGIVCMPAEYSDEANTEAYTKEDLAYLKNLLG